MIRVAVITISDSVVAGTREDRSGAKLRERAESLGWAVEASELVPDEPDQIAERAVGFRGFHVAEKHRFHGAEHLL